MQCITLTITPRFYSSFSRLKFFRKPHRSYQNTRGPLSSYTSVFHLLTDIHSSFVVLFATPVSEMAVPMTRMSELSTSDDAEVEVSTSAHHQSGRKSCKTCIKSPRQRVVLLCVLIAILAAVVGALIGYFVPLALKPSCTKMSSASEDVHKKFADEVSTKELENNLR